MGKTDGKVTLSTKLDLSGIKTDVKSIKSIIATTGKAVAVLGAAAAAAIVSLTKEAVAAYADYEQLTGGVETLFKSSADKVKQYADDAFYTVGISANAYMATVTSFSASLISSLGGDTDKAADVANTAMVDMADNANKMGSSLESVQTAYQGFAKQQYQLLDNLKLGYGGTKTEMERLLKDAEAFSGVKYDINNLGDVYEAIHQIQVKLGVAGTTAKEAEKTITGSANMTKAAWKNVLVAISGGGDLDKAINNLVYSISKYFDNIVPVVERSLSGIGQLVERVAPKLVETIALSLVKAIPRLLYTVYKMILGIASGVYQGIKALFAGKSVEVLQDQAESIKASAKNQEDLKNQVKATGKEAKKTMAGFDEIQTLSSETSDVPGSEIETPTTSSGGSLSMNVDIEGLDDFQKNIDAVYGTMEAILILVGLVGAGILAWKILDAYTGGVSLKGVFKDIGAQALIIAGAILLVKGYCEGWVNGVDWKNLLITLSGIALVLSGITLKFGTFGLAIGLVVAGVATLVLGIKDFIKNGPTMQNTILIIGGAIAVAVGLATAGVSVLVSIVVGAVAAVVAFTAAILLEEPAIMSVQEAQENLNAAKERAAEAENGYINAVDAAEASLNRLKAAEEAAGMTGAELYAQVQSGSLDYANMTAEQKELYKAYIDNEQKQADLKTATEELSAAKKAETLASYENQLAIAKESGNYDEFKKSVVQAFEAGELSADEARELIGKSMSEMSDDAQQTFMEDLPGDIKSGLDPNKYETTRKKMGDWFKNAGKFFIEKIWQPIKEFWNQHIAPIFTKKFWTDLAKKAGNGLIAGFEGAINSIISMFESMINWVVKGLNKIGFDVPDWVPGIGGKKFGFNIPEVKFNRVSIPRLAQGAVIPPNREFMAVLGDQKHGTNIEAPLATIQEAVALVMQDQTAAILTGFESSVGVQREILEAVLGIQIGDDVIGNAVARYQRKQAVMRGGAL